MNAVSTGPWPARLSAMHTIACELSETPSSEFELKMTVFKSQRSTFGRSGGTSEPPPGRVVPLAAPQPAAKRQLPPDWRAIVMSARVDWAAVPLGPAHVPVH